MDSAGKRKQVKLTRCTGRHCRPVLQLPTGQSCSWQTAGPNKLLALTRRSWRTWTWNRWQSTMKQMNGAKQTERGQDVDEGSGHGRQRVKAGKHSPQNKALQADSASGLSVRHRPQNTRTAHSWPALQQTTAADVIRTLAVQVSGGSAMVPALRKAGSDLPNLSLPQLSPLPVIVSTHSLNLKNPI